MEEKENQGLLNKYWKGSCAVVYLTICIFDFLIMPIMLTEYSESLDYSNIYLELGKLEHAQAQVALIQKIDYQVQTWSPLTLQGAGMFHIAFGAILTGAAMARGAGGGSSRSREM